MVHWLMKPTSHQVDLTPGGFQMQGEATKVKGGRTDCLQVDFDVVYRWNDGWIQILLSPPTE
jgi:hypothetical protein